MEDLQTYLNEQRKRKYKMEDDLDESDRIQNFEDFVRAGDRACLYFLYHKLNDFLEWDK